MPPSRREPPEAALRALFRAIATGNVTEALRLLAATPTLATDAAAVGASRKGAEGYFFEEISHYAYAGDTPLHLAAAAHQPDILLAPTAAASVAKVGVAASSRNASVTLPVAMARNSARSAASGGSRRGVGTP